VTGFSSGPEAFSQSGTMYSTIPKKTNTHTHTHSSQRTLYRVMAEFSVKLQRTGAALNTTHLHVFVRLHRLLELSGALNHACNGQHYQQRQQANDECLSLHANPDLLFCCDVQKALVFSPKDTQTDAFMHTRTHKQV